MKFKFKKVFSSRHLALFSEFLLIGLGITILCLDKFIFTKRIIYGDTIDYYLYLYLIGLISLIGIIGFGLILVRSINYMIKFETFLILFGSIQFIVGLTHILLLYNNYYPVLLRLCFIRQPNNEFWRAFGYEDTDGIEEAYSICQNEWEWLSYAHLSMWLIYSLILIIHIFLIHRYSHRLKRNKLSTLNRLVHSSWEDKTIHGNENDFKQQHNPFEEDDEYFFHYNHHHNEKEQQGKYDSDTDSTKSPPSSSPTPLSPVTISSPICQPTKEEIEATEVLANALYKQRQRLYEEIRKNKQLESIHSGGNHSSKLRRKSRFSRSSSSDLLSSNKGDQNLLSLKENVPMTNDEEEKQSLIQKVHVQLRSSKKYPKLSIQTQPTLPPMAEYPMEEEKEEEENNFEKQQQINKIEEVEVHKNEKGKGKEIIHDHHHHQDLLSSSFLEKDTSVSTFLSVSSPTSSSSSISSYRKGSIYSGDEAAFPQRSFVYLDDVEVEDSSNNVEAEDSSNNVEVEDSSNNEAEESNNDVEVEESNNDVEVKESSNK